MATVTWKGTGTTSNPNSGNWGTGSNWSTGSVPAANSDVVLPASGANGAYTVTLNATPNALDSLTINSGATFAVGTRTLSVNGNGVGATDTVTVASGGALTIAGGTINATTLSDSGTVSGSGTLNITGHYTGTGTLAASGGTLDVFGTIDSGVVLAINSSSASTLKI